MGLPQVQQLDQAYNAQVAKAPANVVPSTTVVVRDDAYFDANSGPRHRIPSHGGNLFVPAAVT